MTLDEQRRAARKALETAFHAWAVENPAHSQDADAFRAFRAGWTAASSRSTLTDRIHTIEAARGELQAGDRRWMSKGGNA